MGNRFREKVTEEGLDGRAAEEVVESEAPQSAEADVATADEVDEQPRHVADSRSVKVARGLSKVLGGDILGDKFVLRQIPLLLLCLFFLLLLVANRYRVESLRRDQIATENRINDLREQRIQMQKQYQKSVKISQIAEELAENGVGITSGPPYEID